MRIPVVDDLTTGAADLGEKRLADRGRPSIYTEELASRICERLAAGETLRSICRDDTMPDRTTIRRWKNSDESFRIQYVRAREDGFEDWSEELVEIIDVGSGDPARDRLRFDGRRWLMSKALPKIYGDRQVHEVELGANAQLLALIDGRLGKAKGT